MESPQPSHADDHARVPPWRIWLIEIGATAPEDTSPISGEPDAPEPIDRTQSWQAVTRSVDAVARALGSQHPDGLECSLAPQVLVTVPQRTPRLCSPADAMTELQGWRQGWQNCHVVVCELLMSGSLCAATGFVTGVEHEGAPSALSLHLAWKIAA
jgi:hypothetical protein